MFRPEDGKDITAKQFREVLLPFLKTLDIFLENNVIPEFCAYYIATGYKTDSLWEDTYEIHVNSACDFFNHDMNKSDLKEIRKKTKKILLDKYGLEIIRVNPLKFK